MWFSGTAPSCISGVRLLLPCYTWILHKLADIKFRTMYRCDTYNRCHIMSGLNDTMSTLCLFLFSFISYESSRIWPRIVFISNISLQLGYWYSVHVAILFNSLTIADKGTFNHVYDIHWNSTAWIITFPITMLFLWLFQYSTGFECGRSRIQFPVKDRVILKTL